MLVNLAIDLKTFCIKGDVPIIGISFFSLFIFFVYSLFKDLLLSEKAVSITLLSSDKSKGLAKYS